MNDLQNLKERRAQLQYELDETNALIRDLERERSYLGKLHKALPNSVWAKNSTRIPDKCPREYFGGSAPTSSKGLDDKCCGSCKECWYSEANGI